MLCLIPIRTSADYPLLALQAIKTVADSLFDDRAKRSDAHIDLGALAMMLRELPNRKAADQLTKLLCEAYENLDNEKSLEAFLIKKFSGKSDNFLQKMVDNDPGWARQNLSICMADMFMLTEHGDRFEINVDKTVSDQEIFAAIKEFYIARRCQVRQDSDITYVSKKGAPLYEICFTNFSGFPVLKSIMVSMNPW